MAKLGKILFSRTLNQFLECEDLDSKKGLDLIEKLRESTGDNLDRVFEAISQVEDPHKGVLKNLCQACIDGPALFKRLHEPNISPTDIIDLLASHRKQLKPEDIINHALKLEIEDAIQLLKLVEASEIEIDLSKLSLQTDRVDNPEFKTNWNL